MKENERVKLQNKKLQWRRRMRAFWGKSWTKRKASRILSSIGRSRMNIPKKT